MTTETPVPRNDVRDLPPHLTMAVLKGEISLALAQQLHNEYPWLPWDVAGRLITGKTTENDGHFIEVMSKLDPKIAQEAIDEFSWMPWDMLARMVEDQETDEDRAYVRKYGKTVTHPAIPDNTEEHEVRSRLKGLVDRAEQRLTDQMNRIINRSQDHLERRIRANQELLAERDV
jgi:hypothetical protein